MRVNASKNPYLRENNLGSDPHVAYLSTGIALDAQSGYEKSK